VHDININKSANFKNFILQMLLHNH